MNKIFSEKAFAEELLQFTALKAEQSKELCPSANLFQVKKLTTGNFFPILLQQWGFFKDYLLLRKDVIFSKFLKWNENEPPMS